MKRRENERRLVKVVIGNVKEKKKEKRKERRRRESVKKSVKENEKRIENAIKNGISLKSIEVDLGLQKNGGNNILY